MNHISSQSFQPKPAISLGHEFLLRQVYEQVNLDPLIAELAQRAGGAAPDLGAMFDLSTLLLSKGGPWAAAGLALQREAVALQRSYQVTHGNGTGPTVLALMTCGDFMANTPIDFLLAGSDAVLILHFVDETTSHLNDLPPHDDVAFMAVGEGPHTAGVLARLAELLCDYPAPVLNKTPELIAQLSRDGVSRILADIPGILCPATLRVGRDFLQAAAQSGATFPFYPALVRPLGSHAGHGLSKVDNAQGLANFLAQTAQETFYLTPFVEYRGADGLYAKARVVLIKGQPFASHLACSTHWMVHYLNAEMETNPARRAQEAEWMATFDAGFARRHARALGDLAQRLGLDYFGLDCAELPDGRLLVFELDVAMIVHDLDSVTLFAYKKPGMQKLFAAFIAALSQVAP